MSLNPTSVPKRAADALYPPMNSPPRTFDPARELPPGFLEFFGPLHREFSPRQRQLVAVRQRALDRAHRGRLPGYLPPSFATRGDWRIELPDWCRDQRNQMTGPADDGELVVKMLNSGAPGVMLDLEDSVANRWEHLNAGIENVLAALRGTLSYHDRKRARTIGIRPSPTVVWVRPRGLHVGQAGVSGAEATSASLFDVARVFFGIDPDELRHPLAFSIPKSESAEEALWWRDLFQALARARRLPLDSIKCMALVESHPLAFQIEEFAYHLREHLLGLNLGRWDYLASLIHFAFEEPRWVLPDRNTIPHDVPFFQRLRERMVTCCHRRGMLAIGGMTALYPSREDAALNARALSVLARDKKNEAECGMDGAWTLHPDQNEVALQQFPVPNQLERLPELVDPRVDLRPLPLGVGTKTVLGTRTAVRTVIRYRNGVLHGKGASLLDGYMEDLATDRIYRLMIAQRMRHGPAAGVTEGTESAIAHTPEFVTRLFDEELERILSELETMKDPGNAETFRRARVLSEDMILHGAFDPV
jgi:malate synthase